MSHITIEEENLSSLQGQTVLVTGCSSGIGLATTQLLLDKGAKVFGVDRNEISQTSSNGNFEFGQADITSWIELREVFSKAVEKYGHLDHVFANAGIGPRTNLLEDEFDEEGNLKAPNLTCIDVNLIGAINTVKLGLHYLRKNIHGGSVVLTASPSSFQRFNFVDYTTAKHGVLGMMRSLTLALSDGKDETPKVRINGLAPDWTWTGLVPDAVVKAANLSAQTPAVVAQSVLLLMSDYSRHGQLIYSTVGQYWEIEDHMLEGVGKLMAATRIDKNIQVELAEHGRRIAVLRKQFLRKDQLS